MMDFFDRNGTIKQLINTVNGIKTLRSDGNPGDAFDKIKGLAGFVARLLGIS